MGTRPAAGAPHVRAGALPGHRRPFGRDRHLPDVVASDTAGAVNGGTLYTAVATIDRVTADVAAELGGRMKRVITGGGAKELLPLLAAEYLHEPGLVLQGLAVIAREGSDTRG